MTELERKALLGDRQAQEECTRQGIVLACPCCGCAAALHTTDMFSTIYAVCQKCGLRTSGYHSPDTAIKFWNTRPVPSIGRCGKCEHYTLLGHCKIHSQEPDEYGPGAYVKMLSDDFCSYFESKED